MTHHPGIPPGIPKRGPVVPLLLGLLAGLAGPLRAAVAPPGAERPGQTTIRIEEPSGLSRSGWPVGLGFPFDKGELRDLSSVAVFSPRGDALPLQAKVLSRWPDGSIRWAHILFPADLERQKVDLWRLEWNRIPAGAAPAPSPAARLTVNEGRDAVEIESGRLRVRIPLAGQGLFDSVRVGGHEMLDPARPASFVLTTPGGKTFSSAFRKKDRVSVEESGPLRAIVRIEGAHASSSGQTLFDYIVRLTFHAGQSWFETEYGFVNREAEEWTPVASITLDIPLAPSSLPFAGTTSEYKIDKFYDFDAPFSIYSGRQDFFGVFAGATMFRSDGTEVFNPGYESEARARWWADSSTAERGLTVAIQDMSRNFPKEIRVAADRVRVDFYPGREKEPLRVHQGWRKTHTALLYFHERGAKAADSRELCFSWQAPVIPWSPRHVASGLMGDILPYSPEKYPAIERSLRQGFVGYESGVGRGLIDTGDTVGPGTGERGNFMQNNAYDTPWVAFLLFLRSGERRYWERARAAALHTSDIDIVHHSTRTPVEIGGIRIHGPNHVQYDAEAIAGSSVAPNHEWVEGLLLAYHLTGEDRYLDDTRGVAGHLLRAIDAGWILPPYNAKWNGARNLAWPLLALTVAHDETGEAAFAEGARKIVGGLRELQMPNGSFPITIGPYTAAAPLHNAIVMEVLGRRAAMTGDAEAKAIFLRTIESTLRDLSFPDGEMMYITHPDYRSPYTSMPWGGYHFGYLFTGDVKYLLHPLPLIMRQLQQGQFGTSGEGALSYPLRGMLFYLYHADKAGILKDLPAD
jgi:hypothetical protein